MRPTTVSWIHLSLYVRFCFPLDQQGHRVLAYWQREQREAEQSEKIEQELGMISVR